MTLILTCRTTEESCASHADIWVVYGCSNSHTWDIVVCETHCTWRTVHQPGCLLCGAEIIESMARKITEVQSKYLQEYLGEAPSANDRGGIRTIIV